MDHIEQETDHVDQSGERQIPVISGLPDDISLLCLSRVPRIYHTSLKCVSKRWRDFVCSEEWCDYRNKCNLSESWIYAFCRDKSARVWLYVLNPNSPRRSWKRIQEFPPCTRRREGMGFAVLGKQLYVLGGCGWSEDATDEAFCYDAALNAWVQVPSLSTRRCYFGCETLDGKIYAIGGLGLKPSVPLTWDVYDGSMKTWKVCSDTNMIPEITDSFVMDGRIYIRGGGCSTSSDVCAAVYEPLSGTWHSVDNDMTSGWRGPAVVVGDELYVLDQSFGTTLTMWCKKREKWVRLGRVSRLAMRQSCQLVAIGSSIFVVGKDSYTMVIDVESARTMVDGVMVCSSIPKISDDDIDVISCKCVAI